MIGATAIKAGARVADNPANEGAGHSNFSLRQRGITLKSKPSTERESISTS